MHACTHRCGAPPDAAPRTGRRDPRRAQHRARLRRCQCAHRHQLRRARTRGAGHHRPERCRQEFDAQLHQRRVPAAAGIDHLSWPDLQPHEPAPGGRDGHRPHIPEPGTVQGHERARQHHDRAQPEDAQQPVPAGAAAAVRLERGGSAKRQRNAGWSKRSSISSRSSPTARHRSASSPTACRNASTSAGRWRWNRRCCCSTSRWPA